MLTKPITTTVAALAFVGLLGACGDDGGSGGSGGGSGEQAAGDGQEMFDWVDCMGGEGIDLPEPTRNADGNLEITGDGIYIGLGESSFGEYSDDEMKVAEEGCGPPPLRSGLSDEAKQEEEQMFLEFSRCMRENGLEDFPDPDFSDESLEPEPTPDGEGMISGPLPPVDDSDPEVMAAMEVCEDIMGGGPGGPEDLDEGSDG